MKIEYSRGVFRAAVSAKMKGWEFLLDLNDTGGGINDCCCCCCCCFIQLGFLQQHPRAAGAERPTREPVGGGGGRTVSGSLLKVAKCHCWLSYIYTCVCLCVCQCVYVSVCRRLLLAGPEIPIGGEMPRLAQ